MQGFNGPPPPRQVVKLKNELGFLIKIRIEKVGRFRIFGDKGGQGRTYEALDLPASIRLIP
jgi:hypothetical protein